MVSEFVLGWSGSQGVRIRYEDFIERPEETLVQIGRLSDINLDSIAEDLLCGKPMATGHIIAGNRLRMEEAIYLKRDLEWRSGLSKRAQAVFWLWAGHLAKRYGYDKAC